MSDGCRLHPPHCGCTMDRPRVDCQRCAEYRRHQAKPLKRRGRGRIQVGSHCVDARRAREAGLVSWWEAQNAYVLVLPFRLAEPRLLELAGKL